MRNNYAAPQILFHWLTVLLLAVAYMTIELRGFAVRGSWQGRAIIITHFSAGFCVLLVMLTRLCLRTRFTTPAITPPARPWQSGLAHLVHAAIYALFILLPALALSSRYLSGREWWLFGISMPVAQPPAPEVAAVLIHWHKILAPAGYWLIGLHALAALFHHYCLRDNTLVRMLPRRSR
ncbi:cytochrome b561 [[Erwinia] mediterraneensis]|uniref:cytochrome b561 n=1 Tax=[Erwinia] mediterraneensis TaxID=2161819 RepID=UPI00102FCD0F|nr:cytochrome b561 [[Erwinia] mediterraneensis]